MSVWGAIKTQLTSDATLTALLAQGSSGVWFGRPPSGNTQTKMPYIVYWTTGGSEPAYNAPAATAPYIETIGFQLDVFVESAQDTANTIMKKADKKLNKNLFAVDDATMIATGRTSPLDWLLLDPDPSENGLDVWHGILLYEMLLQRTI